MSTETVFIFITPLIHFVLPIIYLSIKIILCRVKATYPSDGVETAPPRDSGGYGCSDIDEIIAGTDPNSYLGAPAPTPTATPEEPSFEAVFAIASLLAVAYLIAKAII